MKYLIVIVLTIFLIASVSANRSSVLTEDFECWQDTWSDTMNDQPSGSVVCFCRSLVNVTLTGWFTTRLQKPFQLTNRSQSHEWSPLTGWLNWEKDATDIGLGWVSKNKDTNTMTVSVGEWNFYQHTLDMRTITHTTGTNGCGLDTTRFGQSRYKMTNAFRSPCTYMTSTP